MPAKYKYIGALLVIYLATTAGSFYAFKNLVGTSGPAGLTSPITTGTGETPRANTLLTIDPSEPKSEVCPINGAYYTKIEKAVWETRRPLVVMIENHHESRPQLGLSSADVVYEAIAEGGITRFMAVFYCGAQADSLTIGPVRSARTYFLDWASEYSKYPIYVHVGGANTPNKANALGQIEDYGWAGSNDMNQFGLSVKECKRDDSVLKKTLNLDYVPVEHTMHCNTEALWKLAEKRKFTATDPKGDLWTKPFTSWKFADGAAAATPQAKSVTLDFWADFTQYTVRWDYDSTTNKYTRSNGGTQHIDYNTGKPLQASVVILQYIKETGPIDEEKHMLYGTTGTGKATIFQDGKQIEAKWSKAKRLDRTVFTDLKGKEIQFSRGKIWIEELPSTAEPKIE